jgi:hypothetical protein
MDRSFAVCFFVQPMNYKPFDDVILSEAKNLGLVLDASSPRGMTRDVSLSLNSPQDESAAVDMTELFVRWPCHS